MRKQPNSHHCFICGVKNVAGLHVRFYETATDDGTPEILARFTGQPQHQGYPERMHGGVAMGILDETIGRAINIGEANEDHDDARAMTWGVTGEFSLRFHKPVPLGVELTARGRIVRERSRLFDGEGELYLPDGEVAVTAKGTYFKMALDAISDIEPETLGWRIYPD
jgi:acyl-coenzyme A thioesterase PaaI-like protein